MSHELGKTEEDLIKVREEKLGKIRDLGKNPYPARFEKEYTFTRILGINEELIASGQIIKTAGRIVAFRGHGKLVFADLQDESGKIQAVFKFDNIEEKDFELVVFLDLGDFVGVEGKVFITRSGEISIEVKSFQILAKSLRPLPSNWYGISDEELRMRKRYLDILINPELKELFYKKAKFWQTIRNFLLEKNFLEVETPVLESKTGGAEAEPFVTHHNALDIDVYLRISCGELWQKRLLVAGFEKVFEIGRIFRNEGISHEHLQDYTQMEFYWAYADYNDGMKLVEELYKKIAREVFGGDKFTIGDHQIDFSAEWQRFDYVETIKENTGVDILDSRLEQIEDRLSELGVKYDKKGFNFNRAVDNLWKYCRKSISGPGFLVNVPAFMEPLAKRSEKNPKLVERFQVILAGSEVGKGYSELNDPKDQRERFLEQEKLRESGDKEAQMNDSDFVEALEYGMPPACGFGVSERLFAFLAGKPVRECVMFPLTKPRQPNPKS